MSIGLVEHTYINVSIERDYTPFFDLVILLYHIIIYYTIRHYIMLYYNVVCSTILHDTILHYF